MRAMKFIDLFSGLGGFHVALRSLGHTCVFACEIDDGLRALYAKNFGIMPEGDIRKISIEDIPSHDILCAGFPCQPFSKAGDQQGLDCPKWGNLFDYVLKILRYHQPKYFILENVPNLASHDKGETWVKMKRRLKRAGYDVENHRLSPHRFGIPQIRERIYIVGCKSGLNGFSWPEITKNGDTSIMSALEKNPIDAKPLSKQVIECLNVWQDFIRRFPKKDELPSFPIWSMEFGATYPYKDMTPHAVGIYGLRRYRGSHGKVFKSMAPKDRLSALPSYARVKRRKFPVWKIEFIRKNRAFYKKHKSWINKWKPKILKFPPSLQKLEWNCKGEERDIWNHVIQFRASGVRVKRPTYSPSLIAMTATQVPIIAWEKRYMTPRECARLQSLQQLPNLPESDTKAFKALGNAVNTEVVKLVTQRLIPYIIAELPIEFRARRLSITTSQIPLWKRAFELVGGYRWKP
ncbi:MAG: DNA (cytosine-5-)-methyltransferase [Nitrospirae bacterium]|nr:DNA (cytosine-5-)-methyltransferase [Nitrospirota bacterium]